MTVTEAIKWLETVRRKHGEVQVFFDCPKCGSVFTPNTITATAVHVTAKQEKET